MTALCTRAEWNDARVEAAALAPADAPPEVGWLRWLDRRLDALGHPMVTPWWHETLEAFWRSGRTFFACEKGQRATASSTLARALMVESFMRDRALILDQVGICSFVSVDVRGADSAVARTVDTVLDCFGLTEERYIANLVQGRFVASANTWQALAANDTSLSFQLRPPSKGASAAGTFVGFLADEVNIWKQDKDLAAAAADVIEILMGRLHGQTGAHGYLTSTPEGSAGALSTIIAASVKAGSESLFVARLGELGARRDGEARTAFRAYLETQARRSEDPARRESCSRWAADPRLLADPDPRSTHIPTWAARAGHPALEIAECWRLTDVALRDGAEGGDPLDVLMHRYGAQPGGDAGRRLFAQSLIDAARARPVMW